MKVPPKLLRYMMLKQWITTNDLFFFFCHHSGLTWQWLLSPSPTCVRRSSTSPSPLWAWESAFCIASPTPPTMASSPSWTPWRLTFGSTSSWPTWVLAASSLSLPGEQRSCRLFVFSPSYHQEVFRQTVIHPVITAGFKLSTVSIFTHCARCWVAIMAVMSARALHGAVEVAESGGNLQ